MTQPNTDYDNPWKSIIELYFQDFLQFFFPWIAPEINWSREVKFLDKELQKIVRDAEIEKRYADKLVEVYKLNGESALVLCHIEVQSQYESVFPNRMYSYNYRLRDRYNCSVVSLAILGDESETWRPTHFREALWGCSVNFEFPIVKLLDYADQWDELETSRNPFAIVVMAHLKTKETHNNPTERKDWKFHLTTMLYDRGYNEQDILELHNFLDWMMNLPEELERQFRIDLEQFEEARKMKYVSSGERMAEARGKELGARDKQVEIALNMLRDNIPLETIARFTELSIEELQQLQTNSEQS
ncbi:hypothetical protein [Leptolyngbya sp. NIES-2104]|uniref:hypothetical protein n=1 Tax=Leptolyngbya sp. NIES-2104 TaxID=1552121 RepID=UPI0006EC89C4|nr:hypothetical protein [Leptolyngbya sp. NIES-2104]GAP94921.1 hypothetical protein NIES2104_14390 [Leptolyngbya sp. NIES-2104]